jgi:nitroimidazol reductase NimA-like FMN-containing flavoprotein (pyridoxamine 5'-phosphate oxidase superfamily)
MLTKQGKTPPIYQVRRQDRAVGDEAWIKDFLKRAPVGVLASVAGGQPFINTNLFVYAEQEHAIYMHTAAKGRTHDNLENDEKVCFSASEMGRLLPADTAMEFSVEYASVVVFGRVTILRDPEQAKHGLQLVLDKYFPHLRPGMDYHGITLQELKKTAVYRIEIEQWSAKRKQVAEDFPGAFVYGQQPK